jgi:hypothetical protein
MKKNSGFVSSLVIGIVIIFGLVVAGYLIYTHLFSFEGRCKRVGGIVVPVYVDDEVDKAVSIIENKQNPREVCIPVRI